MITENLSTLKIYKLTQEQYDKRLEEGTIDENALYLTPYEAIDSSDIDLSRYATIELLDEKANISHIHSIADINELQSILDTLNQNISVKSDVAHTHEISDVTNLQSSLDEKVSTTRTINGKALSEDITLSATDIGADVSGSADTALSESKIYTDEKVTTINNSISNSVAETKSYADTGDTSTLEVSKTYTDNAVAQKSQVQIITWEDDD